jgi:hypothetical protein
MRRTHQREEDMGEELQPERVVSALSVRLRLTQIAREWEDHIRETVRIATRIHARLLLRARVVSLILARFRLHLVALKLEARIKATVHCALQIHAL